MIKLTSMGVSNRTSNRWNLCIRRCILIRCGCIVGVNVLVTSVDEKIIPCSPVLSIFNFICTCYKFFLFILVLIDCVSVFPYSVYLQLPIMHFLARAATLKGEMVYVPPFSFIIRI
jgi:hypothetical protein